MRAIRAGVDDMRAARIFGGRSLGWAQMFVITTCRATMCLVNTCRTRPLESFESLFTLNGAFI